MTLSCGIVGLGKIARDEHIPAIAETQGMALVAIASRNAASPAHRCYPDLAAMLAGEPELDALILCQPPQVRFASARLAIEAGKHVFLEKPPGGAPGEVAILAELARRQGVTLFASWHSRWSAGVDAFARWCEEHRPQSFAIRWREDVRQWHPGQDWIWQEGGFGVLDPGINALSILTRVLPEPQRVVWAEVTIPENRATPIAARLALETLSGVQVSADFDWRETGRQEWTITATSGDESYVFNAADPSPVAASPIREEYLAMYRHFAQLVAAGASDVDIVPLQLVVETMALAERRRCEPFAD